MQLHYHSSGQGRPLVILHGLFGTLENWGSQVKTLSVHYQVIAVDLRNHGRSPHTATISYPEMAQDIIDLLDQLGLQQVDLLGHSMGGKVAMQLALNHPQRVNRLIVVDIAPVAYPPHHDEVFAALKTIHLPSLTTRSEADQQLAQHIADRSVRAFLLKNLYRGEDKQFHWRMNLALLEQDYAKISAAPERQPNSQPCYAATLFIKGANSDYLQAPQRPAILALFPNARYTIIQGAGHWPHAEKPALFSKRVLDFLNAA